MVRYVKTKHFGGTDAQAFVLHITGPASDVEAIDHVNGMPGLEAVGVLTADEFAEWGRPKPHPTPPTHPDGHNPVAGPPPPASPVA
jgi:hypothetical protein